MGKSKERKKKRWKKKEKLRLIRDRLYESVMIGNIGIGGSYRGSGGGSDDEDLVDILENILENLDF